MTNHAGPTLAQPPGGPRATPPTPLLPSARISGTRVSRQMLLDSVANWAAYAGASLAVILSVIYPDTLGDVWMPLCLVVFGLLGTMSFASVRARRELPLLTLRLDEDPTGTEARITALIRPLPMQRPFRALLYHRLAVLRYRQQRFGETVDICRALLSRPLGRAAAVRPDLLLMLVDASLRRGDLGGAWQGLADLSHCQLRLGDHVQRVALQTRYEVAAGYDRAALAGVAGKIQLAELLPATACAGIHRVLAVAAGRSGQAALAQWLDARARLLAAPEGVGVVA